MKEQVLVLIKPDGLVKSLTGHVIAMLAKANLEIIASKVVLVSKELAEKHYYHIKEKSFYKRTINHLLGKYHGKNKVLALVYQGRDAIKKCRKIIGATNPKEADPHSIRGVYGRVTKEGVFENVVHASSDIKEAKREIKLWFEPDEIIINLYPVKNFSQKKKRVWA